MISLALDTAIKIADGYCQCGCGMKTSLATQSEPAKGYVKGSPMRFVMGHASRLPLGQQKSYPERNGDRLHRLLAERVLGKPLPPRSEVHHVDGDIHNCSHNNLVICNDHSYHMLLHTRQRALYACGHADWLRCRLCRRWGPPIEVKQYQRKNGQKIAPLHLACMAKDNRARRKQACKIRTKDEARRIVRGEE